MSVGFLSFADPPESGGLSEVIGSSNTNTGTESNGGTTTIGGQTTTTTTEQTPAQTQTQSNAQQNTDEFIDGLGNAASLASADVDGATNLNAGIKRVAAWIVRVLSYFIIAFLVVRIVVDICYITLPFTRSFLANGYAGTPQNTANGMQPGMNGMAGGAMGMGMGGMGYGGGYGMHRGYGGYGGYGAGMNNMAGGAMGGVGMQNTMGNQSQSMLGRIQFVSTAALNAVASEASIGPNNKSSSALALYAKDMIVVLVITPILLILAATGVLTNLGFTIANTLVDYISKLNGAI